MSGLPIPTRAQLIVGVGCNKKIIIVDDIDTPAKAADALRLIAHALDVAGDREDGEMADVIDRTNAGDITTEYHQ
jgi:hypothetical protein